ARGPNGEPACGGRGRGADGLVARAPGACSACCCGAQPDRRPRPRHRSRGTARPPRTARAAARRARRGVHRRPRRRTGGGTERWLLARHCRAVFRCTPMPVDLHRRIDAVWREESPRIIAALMRLVRNLDLAEELAQDTLVTALERWPDAGLPDNPGAWLMAAAKNRALDHLPREALLAPKHAQLAQDLDGLHDELHAAREAALDDDIGDDLLRLIFVACHPLLSRDAQVALTLRLLCGLATDEIARAFLVPEATVAQRIVRAKRTLGEADVPFEVPRRDELPDRLSAVLGVVYLVFNEG